MDGWGRNVNFLAGKQKKPARFKESKLKEILRSWKDLSFPKIINATGKWIILTQKN
jgi:hypothetical protein